MLSVLMKMT